MAAKVISVAFIGIVASISNVLSEPSSCEFTMASNRRKKQSSLIQMQSQAVLRHEAVASNKNQNTLVGRCIWGVSSRSSPVHYISEAYVRNSSKSAPVAAQVFEFSGDPVLGMYNPSIVELPTSLQQQGGLSAKFAMTVRRDDHQCQALVSEDTKRQVAVPVATENASGMFLLLNEEFCVVHENPIMMHGPLQSVAQDLRLHVDNGKLMASFVMWQWEFSRSIVQGRGLWLAPIKINASPLEFALDSSEAVRMGKREEKNYGLFNLGLKTMALTWLDSSTKRPKPMRVLLAPELQEGSERELVRAAEDKVGRWHNSANLLRLQDGSDELLGLMHIHEETPGESKIKYGHHYKHKFFKLSASTPYVITAMGEEFCLDVSAEGCESVQMVMSLMQTKKDEILVSYGINDCESRWAALSLSSILQKLRPVKHNVDVMQVPATQPGLHHLADLLAASSFWPYTDSRAAKQSAYSAGLNLQSLQEIDDRYRYCKSVAGTYGDWPVCKDWLPSSGGGVVYDFGIANAWEFSDSMADHHGCEVHAFDPSDGHLKAHRAHQHKSVTFHFLGLSDGKSAISSWTDTHHGYGSVVGPLKRLDAIMASLGHRAIDVLKIDCEGCEWGSLAAVVHDAPQTLACVKVLLMEMHFAKRFGGSQSSLGNASLIQQHLHTTGWKVWFSVQRGWGRDESLEELEDWAAVGGDSCCYNVGLVNPNFDALKCLVPT